MKKGQEPSDVKYFDADRPVECPEQDRLGRRSFAEAIARQLCNVPAEHGFTIAVMGEWGSGKTSVLNMVAKTLQDGSDTIAVLRFNPWLFTGAEDLVTRFFHELSAQLGQDTNEKLKDVAKALSSLGQSLAPIIPVPGATVVADAIAALTDRWAEPQSLLGKRELLREALKKADSRVAVIVDDIDRLDYRETRELMRVVRLTSDLPNVVFLLAFDRKHVAKSLGEDEAEGLLYLDKIVQVSYDLPAVRETIFSDTLIEWLEELLLGRELAQLEKDVWGRVFYEIIRPLLGTLRDVKRYVYSLPVTLDTIGQEVALADLLGLEALRILRPSIFNDLKSHAGYLVHSPSSLQSWIYEVNPGQKARDELSKMIEKAGDDRRILSSVLEILFPVTQGPLANLHYDQNWDGTWRRQRRVACEEVLHIYLQSGLPDGALLSQEVQQLVEALSDHERLLRLLGGLEPQQLEEAIARLGDFEGDFPVDAVPVAVPLLVNLMGRMSDESDATLRVSSRFKVRRVVYSLLKSIEHRDELTLKLDEILSKVDTLSGRLWLTEITGHRDRIGLQLVTEDQARNQEGQLVEQLKSATAEQLLEEWDLVGLTIRFPRWQEEEGKLDLCSKLQEHLREDGFVLALLRNAVSYLRSNGHAEKRLFWDELVEVFGDGLAKAVERLAGSQLCQSLQEDDQDTICLAQRYAAGTGPKSWLEG